MAKNFFKDPILGSVLAIIITFVVIFLFLWLFKPRLVLKTARKKKEIIWSRIVTYSALGGLLVGVIVLLFMADTKKKEGKNQHFQNRVDRMLW